MTTKPKKIQARRGGPKGNQHKVYHGCYGNQILDHEKADFRRIRNGSIEHELKMLRLRLIRLQKKESEYLVDRRETGKDTETGLELVEIERKQGGIVGVGGSDQEAGQTAVPGEEVKKVRKRPDFDNIALRLVGEIARLEKLRVSINVEAKNEKAQKKKTLILQKFRKGELTAVEAACLIEEAGLTLPDTIAIVLKNTPQVPPEPEEPEEYGYSDEELEARYQESLDEEKRQVEEFLPEREQEIRTLKDELKGQGSFDVEAMIKKAEAMGDKAGQDNEETPANLLDPDIEDGHTED